MRSSSRRAESVAGSFRFALKGVGVAFAQERNFRVQASYALLVLALLLLLQPRLCLVLLNLFSVLTLLAAELANSALERAVDLACPEPHPLAGEAKDMAAGAVMLISFGSAAVLLFTVLSEWSAPAALGVGGLLFGLGLARRRGTR